MPSVVCGPVTSGFAAVPQQTPRAVMAEPPSQVAVPPEVAVVAVMAETAVVVTPAPGTSCTFSEVV